MFFVLLVVDLFKIIIISIECLTPYTLSLLYEINL